MAERTDLNEIPGRSPGGQAVPLYDRYFDGAVWRLTLGEDTRTKDPKSASQTIWKRAKELGVHVTVHVEPGGKTILVQKTGDR